MLTMAAALCGCSEKEILTEEPPQTGGAGTNEVVEPMVFTATMEGAPETKATYDGTFKCASWEVDDRISINGILYQAQTAGTSTTFSESVVMEEIRPTYVSTETPGHYGSLEAKMLVDDTGATNEWCTPTSAKVNGVWNIVVSTGVPVKLNSIKLWNARNTETNYGRTWKKVKVYGSNSADGPWGEPIGDFDNLNLAINNYGYAGELEINAEDAYTFYRIDVLENKGGTGDDYMQMADMKFVVDNSISAPYDAYFPASLYNGTSAVLPANITETWADGKFNMPMYAHSESTNLQFKNLCGVLKVIVKNDRLSEVKGIRVSSANKATSGAFTVNSDNAAVLTNPTNPANTVTVTYTEAVPTTAEGTVFYVAIPAQTYRGLKIELSANGVNFTKAMTTKQDADIVVERNKIYPINHVMTIPSGAIPHAFTVNALDKQVYFSKGNLQATFLGGDPTNYSWGFAQHQYDLIGRAAGNTTIDNQTKDAVVDLFGWSTPSTYYGISTLGVDDDYSGSFVDWGKNIGDGSTWRTLSQDEWKFLLSIRFASTVSDVINARYAKGRVQGTDGLIILPDSYTHPAGVTPLTSINAAKDAFDVNRYDLASWSKMEAAGCVFLPAAGYCCDTRSVIDVYSSGYYWSATSFSSGEAYRLYFSGNSVEWDFCVTRSFGHSVRLVTDVK